MDHFNLYIKSNNPLQETIRWNPESDDAGVDLYCPETIIIPAHSQGKINFGIQCSVTKKFFDSCINCGYFLLPRSSIIKTPLRMSNSVGLIDAGYRGDIMAVVDNISDEDFIVEKGSRYFQIANSQLIAFSNVELVEELDTTLRGSGGFGSTGLQ